VVVEAVDFFNVTKDDIAFATQGLGYILAWQFRDIILKKLWLYKHTLINLLLRNCVIFTRTRKENESSYYYGWIPTSIIYSNERT
jgi:hypothetical protein